MKILQLNITPCLMAVLVMTILDHCHAFTPISNHRIGTSATTSASASVIGSIAYTSRSNTKLYAEKKQQQQQQQGRGFQQTGGPIDNDLCSLSEDEILQFLKQRAKARRMQNFHKADEILSTLRRYNVFVNDSTKQWRADGQAFVDYDGNGTTNDSDSDGDSDNGSGSGSGDGTVVYTKARNSKSLSDRDEEYILNKLRERYIAKMNRDYDTADDILDELKFMKNVQIDDKKKEYRAVDPFKLEYTFGGKRTNNINPDVLKEIEYKVKERANAKKKKNYSLADALLKQLTDDHGIRVDDAKKEWHFMSRKGDDDRFIVDTEEDNRKKGIVREGREENYRDTSSDWSEVDSTFSDILSEASMAKEEDVPTPDGIVIDDAIPDGIVIDDEEGPANNQHDGTNKVSGAASVSKSDLESMTVPILKEKLREAGLPVSGRKMELIERLIDAN